MRERGKSLLNLLKINWFGLQPELTRFIARFLSPNQQETRTNEGRTIKMHDQQVSLHAHGNAGECIPTILAKVL